MAQKPNFLKKLISGGLVGASTIAFIAGASSTALGAVITTGGAEVLNAAGTWAPNQPATNDTIISNNVANTINANVADFNIASIIVDNAGAVTGALTATSSLTIGSIIATAPGDVLPITGVAGQTLTFTGTAGEGAAVGQVNVYTGLGQIDYNNTNFIVTFNPANANTGITLAGVKVANAANGTFNVTNVGSGLGNQAKGLEVQDVSFATVKTINVTDGSLFRFNSTSDGAGNDTLTLQAGGNVINLEGSGTLHLASKVGGNGNAANFLVTDAKTLGGRADDGGDNNGIIHFDTTAIAGTFSNVTPGATAVVGTDNKNRAQQLIVTATAGNAATINGQVYAKDLTLNGGAINFGQIVDVGEEGTTSFVTGKVSTVAIAVNSNLGGVDFANTASSITVADTKTLTGNFAGDIKNDANTAGVITFAANGTLAAANADAETTSNITAIESAAAGAVQLSGAHTAELRLGDAGSIFKLADGTIIDGKVNQTALLSGNALANGAITLDGDATITGDIGNGGGGAALQTITLANDASKTLTLGGANIIGANAGGVINFQANGGTLVLNSTANNVVVNFDLALAADQKGSVDASSLTNAQTLTISGAIGNVVANKALDQLAIGSSKTILDAGDVAVNELVIGNGGSVQLGHNTYLITKTNNAAGQGKIIVVADAAAGDTTLAAGTNLGSEANPLAEINFAALGGNVAALVVNKNANLYATQFTTATNQEGDFKFTNGGTSVIGGTVGTQANQFNTVTVTGGTTAKFTGNAIFAGASTIGADSTLQIGGNYTANSIVADGGAGNGTLQFVNNTPVILTVTNQAAAVNALSTIKFSGSGDVTFNPVGADANPGVTTDTFTFDGNSLGAKVFLAKGVALDNTTIISTVGNGPNNSLSTPVIVVNGVDSTIAANQAIGDAKNIVGISLASDNTIDVQAPELYAGIAAINDGEGTVQLNGGNANVPGTIYGLGAGNGQPKLKLVEVNTNYKNFGNTTAKDVNILDGVTYQAGGQFGTDFDGTITLGSANGNSTVIFADGTNSTATSKVVAFKANNGTVTYLGAAKVGNVGAAAAPVASVKFTGNGNDEVLLGSIFSKNDISFGNNNIYVNAKNSTLSADTVTINGNINLGTNILTFESGDVTWGSATSLNTTLSEASGVLGKVVIADDAEVNAQNGIPLTVNIQDNASADFTVPQTYTLIQGGKNFKGSFGEPNFVNGSNRYVNYTVEINGDKDYILKRTNDAVNVLTKDIGNSKYSKAVSAADIAAFTNQDNTGLARAAYASGLKANNSTDAANFLGSLVSNASAAITTVNIGSAKTIISALANRVENVRYLGAPDGARENMLAAPEGGAIAVAAGDEAVDNVAYGAWIKPFYKDEHQKAKGGVAGHKAKTTGGVIGLDTMANDNLMIGAAVGITKTDMKHQDYNKGNKTDINGFSFSLYGAQQLVNNFFAQGSTIFSVNQVKNKSQRYVIDNNGNPTKQVASGNYDNMTFGGNLMLGYDANVMEGMLITPMAGLNYLKSSDENYKETGATFVKQVNSKFSDRTDVIAGAKVMGSTINISDFAVYPEAHAFITHKISGKLSRTQSYLDGQVQPYVANGDKTAKTSYNVGLSASVRPDAKMEYGIGYDFDAASKYTAHQGTVKVRVNF